MARGLGAPGLWTCRCSLRQNTKGSGSGSVPVALTAFGSAGFLGLFSHPILMPSLRHPMSHLHELSVHGLGPIQCPEAAVDGGKVLLSPWAPVCWSAPSHHGAGFARSKQVHSSVPFPLSSSKSLWQEVSRRPASCSSFSRKLQGCH